jgi:hypothetical protein
MKQYIALARMYGRTFYVGEKEKESNESWTHFQQINGVRDFKTFEEADEVARDLAAGKYPALRPAGEYINNR